MTVSAINPFLPPPPDAGASTYGDILDSIFGNLSAADKQKIWVKFLTDNNLPQPVPPPGSEQLFLTYLNQVVTSEQFSQKVYVNDKLSPEEMKKRNIMFQVLNSVVSMLLSLQSTVTVQAQNIAIFARWQKEYTNMLTRVPTLVGGEASNVVANTSDLSKFTLGYNDISIRDIAQWWAQQRLDGKSDTFTITLPSYYTNSNDPNTYVENGSINFTPTGIQFQGFTVSIPAGGSFDTNVANFERQFAGWWNGNPSVSVSYFQLFPLAGFVTAPASSLPLSTLISNYSATVQPAINAYVGYIRDRDPNDTRPAVQTMLTWGQIFSQSKPNTDPYAGLEILKPYTYVSPAGITDPNDRRRTLSDAAAKARGEINSKEQQFTESIRSKRQVIQDTQSALQSNLDQSRQTYSQQSDLLTSLIDSLKGLLSSIFR